VSLTAQSASDPVCKQLSVSRVLCVQFGSPPRHCYGASEPQEQGPAGGEGQQHGPECGQPVRTVWFESVLELSRCCPHTMTCSSARRLLLTSGQWVAMVNMHQAHQRGGCHIVFCVIPWQLLKARTGSEANAGRGLSSSSGVKGVACALPFFFFSKQSNGLFHWPQISPVTKPNGGIAAIHVLDPIGHFN